MMSKEKKQVYISEMSSQLDKAEAVIVAHYQGLTVKQLDELRKKMREHGIQFKITKNRITKLALEKLAEKIYQIYSQVQQLLQCQMMQ